MARPGTNTRTSQAIISPTAPTNTGTWFAIGATQAGTTVPTLVTSFAQYLRLFGGRGTFSQVITDSVETFFAEGGKRVYIGRVVGSSGVSATHVLAPETAMTATAKGSGAWGNSLKVKVTEPSTGLFVISVYKGTELLETSPPCSTAAEIVKWAESATFISITGATLPEVQEVTLATGADDTGKINTASYEAALALLTSDLGPGQVSVPGVTTAAVQEAVYAHCAGKKSLRIGIVDMADNITEAELLTAVALYRALGNETARCGGAFAPWADIAPAPGSLITRSVPPSPFVAAKCAVVDANGNVNQAPAGRFGVLTTALDFHAKFTDAQRETLNAAGVNVLRMVYGEPRIYGFRSTTNPASDPLNWMLNNIRTDMAIVALGGAIAESFVFSDIDGQGLDASAYGAQLRVMLAELYVDGALFGENAGDSFSVDVSSDLNTLQSESEGNLLATVAVRRAPMAELVELNMVRVPITSAV